MASHLEQFQVLFFVHRSDSTVSPLVELALGCCFHIGGAFLPFRDILGRGRKLWTSRHLTLHARHRSSQKAGETLTLRSRCMETNLCCQLLVDQEQLLPWGVKVKPCLQRCQVMNDLSSVLTSLTGFSAPLSHLRTKRMRNLT